MFALFFSLYYAMFIGEWQNLSQIRIMAIVKPIFNKIGEVLTNIFNGTTTPITDLGDVLFGSVDGYYNIYGLLALILATITSIGIVVMAVKGIKKVFGIFFMGLR